MRPRTRSTASWAREGDKTTRDVSRMRAKNPTKFQTTAGLARRDAAKGPVTPTTMGKRRGIARRRTTGRPREKELKGGRQPRETTIVSAWCKPTAQPRAFRWPPC